MVGRVAKDLTIIAIKVLNPVLGEYFGSNFWMGDITIPPLP